VIGRFSIPADSLLPCAHAYGAKNAIIRVPLAGKGSASHHVLRRPVQPQTVVEPDEGLMLAPTRFSCVGISIQSFPKVCCHNTGYVRRLHRWKQPGWIASYFYFSRRGIATGCYAGMPDAPAAHTDGGDALLSVPTVRSKFEQY